MPLKIEGVATAPHSIFNAMRRWSHLAAVAAACLAVPATASAAYAPKLTASLEPATPSSPAAITTTVSQATGETASKTVKVSFPSGFSVNNPTIGTCSESQQAARACPADSRIGDASATASVVVVPVDLSGGVYYGGFTSEGKIKLIVFLDNAQLDQHVTAIGLISVRPADNGFDAVFDNLPDTLTTKFTLKLAGETKALSLTPKECGDYTFKATFTSQKGETATSDAKVTVAGCTPPKLVISPLDLSPSPASPKRGATLEFNLTDAAQLTVTVKRAGGKQAFRKVIAGKKGINRLRGVGKGLKRGRYAVKVSAVATEGRRATRSKTLVVR
jgi:hypothetical protein